MDIESIAQRRLEIKMKQKEQEGENERGHYKICPICKEKCYYRVYGVDEEGECISYCCECDSCNELLDED